MFTRILIANRGEIACRIIRTVQKMGIEAVAIYSEADTNALHVKMADDAYYVGHSPANQSYLHIPHLLDAIRKSGSDAVHPGYGFLSENSRFARAIAREGVTFIGPSAKAIQMMGDKIEAKKLAQGAGVSTIPGTMGTIGGVAEAIRITRDIGFPVMIKAAAGGGGKGMRVVRSEKEVEQAFISATNEATNSFSDGRIFIEKYIEQPRHIEIQVLADKAGNTICVGERECSIQRHHQKVIEEAPSSFIDEETRQKMYAQVKALAAKVGYYSAGTVEFIMDKDKHFYFLEMNTRLQVEHCVTELVTGIDLVEQMIRVAAGETLTLRQEDITLEGWAIESRIYAEDPKRGFLPSSGRIIEYKEPVQGPNVRVDTGVYEGGEVSMFYDPMIAKLSTYGKTRDEAIRHMQNALGQYVIRGISHNISFLEALIQHERFGRGDISTNFIAEEYPGGFSGAELTTERGEVFLCSAVHIFLTDAKRAVRISGQVPGRERQIGTRWVVTLDKESFSVYTTDREGGYDIRYGGQRLSVRTSWVLGSRLLQGMVNGRPVSVHIEECPGGYYLTHAGARVKATVRTPRVAELSKFMAEAAQEESERALFAPISGKVILVKVAEGDKVKAGQELVVLEAMKMENVIYAEQAHIVSGIHVQNGESVHAEQLLISFTAPEVPAEGMEKKE